jgi:hypothetical protein
MKVQATFTAQAFRTSNDYTTLTCRETGQRYSFAERAYEPFPVFREGQVIAYRRGRAAALGLIESDAKWQIRDDLAKPTGRTGQALLCLGLKPT